ncbi:isochorismatase family cysteine hydrolase [Bdellovibrio sp. HCB274]|uniref:isochorismatase family cysteine hydrolase n=1 Tax=Bdellovibrio sp. HCB274 TaxID=3394361 RepID=UPI0039B36EA0
MNDNFGHWKEDWKSVYEICAQPECPGAKIATMLRPEKSDYFVLKPRHSGFYYTSLQILLDELKVKRLIITGIAGNICVWFTANDAHMLDYEIWVPQDCVASNTFKENNFALSQMKSVLSVKTSSSTGRL